MEVFIGLVVGFIVFLFGFHLGREINQDAIDQGFFEHDGKIYRVVPAEVK